VRSKGKKGKERMIEEDESDVPDDLYGSDQPV
jgi:hypothetical protein